jgi:acyl dehydratase
MTWLTTIPEVGAALDPVEHRAVTRSDIVRYAGASGDFNPIHHDEVFAKSAGFPTVFSIGMFQAGLLANYAADIFGPRNVRRVSLRFSSQVWPGDVLTCNGRVIAVDRTPDGTAVEVEVECTRVAQDGVADVAISGSVEFLLP